MIHKKKKKGSPPLTVCGPLGQVLLKPGAPLVAPAADGVAPPGTLSFFLFRAAGLHVTFCRAPTHISMSPISCHLAPAALLKRRTMPKRLARWWRSSTTLTLKTTRKRLQRLLRAALKTPHQAGI
jgi:hypothetical protein